VLATVPVRDGVETGIAVALGILLDTFVVRSLLVPGLMGLIGRKAWWPIKLATGAAHELCADGQDRRKRPTPDLEPRAVT